MSKKLYWFYKATVIHSGAVCAESEEQAIEKVAEKTRERIIP